MRAVQPVSCPLGARPLGLCRPVSTSISSKVCESFRVKQIGGISGPRRGAPRRSSRKRPQPALYKILSFEGSCIEHNCKTRSKPALCLKRQAHTTAGLTAVKCWAINIKQNFCYEVSPFMPRIACVQICVYGRATDLDELIVVVALTMIHSSLPF